MFGSPQAMTSPALVALTAGTGMRQGEVFGLTLPRLDLLRRVVQVERELVTVQARAPHLGPPKTQASVRTIPLPSHPRSGRLHARSRAVAALERRLLG
jgi:integrase